MQTGAASLTKKNTGEIYGLTAPEIILHYKPKSREPSQQRQAQLLSAWYGKKRYLLHKRSTIQFTFVFQKKKNL